MPFKIKRIRSKVFCIFPFSFLRNNRYASSNFLRFGIAPREKRPTSSDYLWLTNGHFPSQEVSLYKPRVASNIKTIPFRA
jgi:hypothetical protein